MATWQLGRNYEADPAFAIEDQLRARAADEARRRYFAENPGNETGASVRERIAKEEAVKGGYYTPEMESAVPSIRMGQMQAKAQLDATQFEMRYTAKQKAEIAANNAEFASAIASGRFTDSELTRLDRIRIMKNLGIVPSLQPRVSDYPPGRGPGDDYYDEKGIHWIVDKDGIKHPMPIKGTVEELALMNENKILAQNLKSQGELNKIMIQNAYKPVATGEKDADGLPITRPPTPEEVRMSIFMQGGTFIQPTPEEAAILAEKADAAGRERVAAQRAEAGLPSFKQAPAAQPKQPAAAPAAKGKNAAAIQTANSILLEAVRNPDRMKSDPQFAAQARQAKIFLESQ